MVSPIFITSKHAMKLIAASIRCRGTMKVASFLTKIWIKNHDKQRQNRQTCRRKSHNVAPRPLAEGGLLLFRIVWEVVCLAGPRAKSDVAYKLNLIIYKKFPGPLQAPKNQTLKKILI